MNTQIGKFRFTYFSEHYQKTYRFYHKTLGLTLAHDWDRNEHDKGALFEAGKGLIEILHKSDSKAQNAGLDYRSPQGVFMCIQVFDIDERYQRYKELGLAFKQEITDQSWGHRSFSVIEPNGLVLFFFEERFNS